jgi:hypothetical protein
MSAHVQHWMRCSMSDDDETFRVLGWIAIAAVTGIVVLAFVLGYLLTLR